MRPPSSIAKYAERRAPRYTSYPTAPHFGPAVDAARYGEWLAALDPAAQVSLYLHVPFCRVVCWYCACNMKLAAREEPVRAYGRRLEREIALVAERLPARMKVSRIHWGGGTPTSLPAGTLGRLTGKLRAAFDVLPDAEIAFELDPRTFAPQMAPLLARLGATRASLGVQEFDPKVQAAVNRVQPFETVRDTVGALREAGIAAINFDLMYGLPHQTTGTLARTVERTLELAPDRIALFGYAHVPWVVKRQRMLPEEALPGPDERFAQAETAAAQLVAAGYRRIGLDHFALAGDGLAAAAARGALRRNFQGYTDDAADALIGLGATAISSLPQGYAQNVAETGAYGRLVSDGGLPTAKGLVLTAEDRMRREVIERLMCDLEVDTAAVAAAHGRPAGTFAPELARCDEFVAEGLALVDGARLTVCETGRPALRVIASVFDAYLERDSTVRRHAVAV